MIINLATGAVRHRHSNSSSSSSSRSRSLLLLKVAGRGHLTLGLACQRVPQHRLSLREPLRLLSRLVRFIQRDVPVHSQIQRGPESRLR